MPIDYRAVRTENEKFYGTGVNQWAPKLLADRYDDRTHFIFELLQNAEDAMSKRAVWKSPRTVEFSLSLETLIVTHYGKIFDEEDVRGICGIGTSTKEEELTSIGRFGIGFKSVYALTDSPEIHSGHEHFAIDSYVLPRAVPAIDLPFNTTEIHIPFCSDDRNAVNQTLRGLQKLGPRTLLFLREIEEISWSHIEGLSGSYCRESKPLTDLARLVTVIGQDNASEEIQEEQWIVFSKAVFNQGEEVGNVEIAFRLEGSSNNENYSVQTTIDSDLVVFFPTVRSTGLGFLVQGPYRTTPSRDNVPESAPWNQHLVLETSKLLVDALREFRELGILSIAVLNTLPLDASRFLEGSWLAPLFDAVRKSFISDPLLPCYKGDYASALGVRLARTQDLRDLVNSEQLTDLFDSDIRLRWLSEKITADLTPELVNYLKDELNVHEITPDNFINRLDQSFLEKQPDEWIERLYEFLNGRGSYFLSRLRNVPLIRLEDGSHIIFSKNRPQVYLPSADNTDYPTVRRNVCRSEGALDFLESLGLTYPDPVDDVITNVLSKYRQASPEVTDDEYHSDIERLFAAYNTDSTSRRNKLETELKKVRFIIAVDTCTGIRQFARPDEVYQATQRLKDLFDGVHGVLIVDDTIDCLHNESICSLLEKTGAARYLEPIEVKSALTPRDRAKLRLKTAGTESFAHGTESYTNWTLRGLEILLEKIEDLPYEEALNRTSLLWKALCDVQENEGRDIFESEYSWKRYNYRRAVVDARFITLLNEAAWVPNATGTLQRPESVMFKDTGWQENPFLLTKIHFKPSIINRLAHEAGVEPGVIELLSKFGLTSVEKLSARLRQMGLMDDESDNTEQDGRYEYMQDMQTVDREINKGDQFESPGKIGPTKRITKARAPLRESRAAEQNEATTGTQEFVTYIAVSSREESEIYSDGLSAQSHLKLEEQAINMILQDEPQLERMDSNNPGYDMRELDSDGRLVRLVEVKAMTGTLLDRPVTLSRTQFEYAQEYEERYWLYVVENAANSDRVNIVKIKNLYGRANTFTFDRGWAAVADAEAD